MTQSELFNDVNELLEEFKPGLIESLKKRGLVATTKVIKDADALTYVVIKIKRVSDGETTPHFAKLSAEFKKNKIKAYQGVDEYSAVFKFEFKISEDSDEISGYESTTVVIGNCWNIKLLFNSFSSRVNRVVSTL